MNDEGQAEVMGGKEILVVASKLRKYVKDAAGMNTAGNVAEVLSDKIRQLTDAAIERAKSDGRKTLKDRDFTAEQVS
jgi:histone H3/H4